MKVRLSGSARSYIRKEAAYLSNHSPSAAKAFRDRIEQACRNLVSFPELGRGIERLPVKGSRRLIVGDYVLDYDFHEQEIIIVSIRHGQQLDIISNVDDDLDFEDRGPSGLLTGKP